MRRIVRAPIDRFVRTASDTGASIRWAWEPGCILPVVETLRLAARAGLLHPSPTLGITARAKAMKAAGQDVISLAAGEPDFATPQAVCEAAIKAIKDGYTKYTPTAGAPELRQAIVRKLARENGVDAKPEQIIVSCGAKHSLFNIAMTVLEPGDEAIVFSPFWMTYGDQIRIAGGRPVAVATRAEHGFEPDLDDLRRAITPKTRMVLINSPSNPTGAAYSAETLHGIAEIADRHGLWIVSDEIYEHLVYDGPHASMLSVDPNLRDRIIYVGGCSKSYAMTGWRIGFAYAPLPVARAMSNLQDQVTSNATSVAQMAAVAAFDLPAKEVDAMRAEFRLRRDLIVGLLNETPGVKCGTPKGAFYAFPDVSDHLNGKSDMELAERLLDKAGVATIPGSVFEGAGHLRLSYAASQEDIRRGLSRIAEVLKSSA